MLKKKWLMIGLILVVAAVMAACGKSQQGGGGSSDGGQQGSQTGGGGGQTSATVWKMQGDQTADFWWNGLLQQFADNVSAGSNGQLKIEFYPANGLGINNDAVPAAISAGSSVQMVEMLSSYVSGRFPYIDFLMLPMVAGDYDLLAEVHEKSLPLIREQLEKDTNSKLLAVLVPTPLQLLVTKELADSEQALNGMRIRTLGGTDALFIEKLGGTPTTIPPGDVPTALGSNQIDGVIMGSPYLVGQRLFEFAPHMYAWNALRSPGFLLVNKKHFESLPQDVQEVLVQEAQKLQEENWQRAASMEASLQEQGQKEGMVVHNLPPKLESAIMAAAQEVWKVWGEKGDLNKQLLQLLLQ